jgi:hypothetical protein
MLPLQEAGSAPLVSCPRGQLTYTTPSETAPLCCPVKVKGPLSQVLQPAKGWACSPTRTLGLAHQCLHHQGQLHCVAQARSRISFPGHYSHWGGKTNFPAVMPLGPAIQTTTGGKQGSRKGIIPAPMSPHGREWQGQLSFVQSLRAGSFSSPDQDQNYYAAQARYKVRSPEYYNCQGSGLALSSSWAWGQLSWLPEVAVAVAVLVWYHLWAHATPKQISGRVSPPIHTYAFWVRLPTPHHQDQLHYAACSRHGAQSLSAAAAESWEQLCRALQSGRGEASSAQCPDISMVPSIWLHQRCPHVLQW